jgi:hypothetical protein
MSWEAVTWANKQRLKKSYEQIVLLVLANAADPNGEAFVKWPGRDHWWVYLSELTRLPKSSLFRHLNTLVALGLGERTMQVLADGARRPTFKLNMNASFDIDLPEDNVRYNAMFAKGSSENQSPVGTEQDDGFDGDENDNDISHSQGSKTAEDIQSPVGTGNSVPQSPVGTNPFPVLRLQEDSLLVPKDSPLPPSGGLPVRDDLWEQFVASWGEPIPKMAIARMAWEHAETAKRAEIVAAARGYWAWLKAHPKPPSASSAQSFIRDAVGWAQWLRYTPKVDGLAPPASGSFTRDSREGRAIGVVYEVAGKGDFLRQFMLRNNAVNYPLPITPRLIALADAPPRSQWVTLGRQQAGAWDSLLSEAVHVQVRNHLREGACAPWPWPPRKDGTLSPTGPPETLIDEADLQNFK